MKKTLLALAIMAASGSLSAAEIYSTDTSKFSLKGEVDGYLLTSDVDGLDGTTTKSDPDASYWAKIQVDAEQKINDTLTAFASFEIEGDDTYLELDDVYVGFKTDTLGIAIGEVGDFAESMNVLQKDDITNEGNYFGTTTNPSESGGHSIAVKGEFVEGLVLVADAHTQSDDDQGNIYGVSADYTFSGYSIGAAFLTGDAAENVDYSVAGVSATADLGGFFVTASYTEYEGNKKYGYWTTDDYLSGSSVGLAASYQLDKTRLYTTYVFADADENTATGASADVDTTNLVLGVDYALSDNVTLLAEYQIAEFDNGSETFDAYGVTTAIYYVF